MIKDQFSLKPHIITLPQNVRDRKPLIHCLTNVVAAHLTANVLLAIGASPAMVRAPEETEDFAGIADALLVNLGMLDMQQLEAIQLAVRGACRAKKPWVLDPLTAGLPFRLNAAKMLLQKSPSVIRGNASEIIALAEICRQVPDWKASGGRGTESTKNPEEALDSGYYLARTFQCVIGISGPYNYVMNETQCLTIEGGHPFMSQIAGMGCALNAVIAAYIVAAEDAFTGTAGAIQLFSFAAKQASIFLFSSAEWGPASFEIRFLNSLNAVLSLPPIS